VHSQTTLDWLNYRGTPSRYPHGSKEADLLAYLKARGYDVTQIQGDRDLTNSDALKAYNVIILLRCTRWARPHPRRSALRRGRRRTGRDDGVAAQSTCSRTQEGVKDNMRDGGGR